MKILIVEDEKTLCETIGKHLTAAGYTVDMCFDGDDALFYIEGTEYDAVVLDIMLPGTDGLTILKTIRDKQNLTPVLLLTAKSTVEDKVKGLDCGADDYLTKPFSLDELTARLRVLIRRQGGTGGRADNTLTVGPLTLDTATRSATRDGKEIKLIEQHIWNYDYTGSSNVIDVYIRTLRKKIDADFDVKLIQTVRGMGYVIK